MTKGYTIHLNFKEHNMKQKKRIEALERRIKDYEAMIAKDPRLVKGYHKPGAIR